MMLESSRKYNVNTAIIQQNIKINKGGTFRLYFALICVVDPIKRRLFVLFHAFSAAEQKGGIENIQNCRNGMKFY